MSIANRIRQSQRDHALSQQKCITVKYRDTEQAMTREQALAYIIERCRKCEKRSMEAPIKEFAKTLVNGAIAGTCRRLTYHGDLKSAAFVVEVTNDAINAI